METRVTTAEGIELFVRVIGKGAPVIVPLACWSEEYEVLADSSQVVLYDPRGRGRSSPAAVGCVSFEADIRDLEAVRAALDLDMVALVGSSYFGGVAARYAMLHPERVARLVLASGSPVRAGSFFRAVQEEQAARLQALAPDLVREIASGAPQTRERLQAYWDAFVQSRAAIHPPWPAMKSRPFELENEQPERFFPLVAAAMRSMGDWDWRADAHAIDAPTLVIDGAADILPYQACREWLAALPNARAVVLEGAGHFLSFEAPERFFALLREFLVGDWPELCTTSL